MLLLNELKRRNVLRVGAGYVVGAWLLIQVAETLFPLFGFDHTPARIVVIVLAIAFVPVLIFAWAYELTPEGLKKDSDVDRTHSIAPNTGKKLDRVIMVVLALALGYFAFDKFVLDPVRDMEIAVTASQAGRSAALVESYGEKSIAVLSFQDMSQDKDQEYLSDGIAEELLNLLARVPKLRVISRSSAFSYKGKDIKLAQVAEELNVAHILEGSVRKAGNRVRITVQLIEARTDTHLWSQTYDRTLDDIFAIQDEIAATVVEQLKITLLGAVPKVQETDPETYTLSLQARHLAGRGTAEGYELSFALYKQALALDPGYAVAWMGLANVYDGQIGMGLLPADEGSALVLAATEKALLIDPDFAYAVASLGWIAMIYDNDLAAAARHFARALALEPTSPSIIGQAATLMATLGRLEQAIALFRDEITRNPLGSVGYTNLGIAYYNAGRWDEAIAASQTALRLSPGYACAHMVIGASLLLKGEPETALAAMQQEEFEFCRLLGLTIVHHALGQTKASDAVLAELIAKYEQVFAYDIAYVLAYRNEVDRAFEWLDKTLEYSDTRYPGVVTEPMFTNIHSDPRWTGYVERVGGYQQAQLDAIIFEVTLPK